jgi:hypothetical protein
MPSYCQILFVFELPMPVCKQSIGLRAEIAVQPDCQHGLENPEFSHFPRTSRTTVDLFRHSLPANAVYVGHQVAFAHGVWVDAALTHACSPPIV